MESLVLVHGYMGGSPQWAGQLNYFSSHFRIHTIDLPGFGLNNAAIAPDSIQGFGEFVIARLDELGVERFHLLGHSMGGMIVQEVVKLVPSRINKLVLYGTGPVGVMPGRFETIEESAKRVLAEGVEATARRISATWFLDRETAGSYADCADIAVLATQQAAIAGLKAMESWSGVDNLKNIEPDTLVLWGDHDRAYQWSQPKQLWQDIPRAQLAVVPGCSHAVHLEKPDLFNAIVLDFLSDQIPRTPD